jgi:hypothetical protein
LARNLFEAAVARHASRIVAIDKPSRDELCTLLPADVPEPGAALDAPAAPGPAS